MEKSILIKDEVRCCFILKLTNYVFLRIIHFLIPLIFIFSTISFLQAQSVITDKLDYASRETAFITAINFQGGETIQFQVIHIDGKPNAGNGHEPWFVIDGGANDLDAINGIIKTFWFVDHDDSFGSTFTLTAKGLTSGLVATYEFMDDNLVSTTITSNYNGATKILNKFKKKMQELIEEAEKKKKAKKK